MREIKIDNEAQLIKTIKESDIYNKFKKEQLDKKIQREKEAWNLVQNNKGIYNKELLNKIFDKVDYFEPNKRWFGQLLAQPNRNLIFESSDSDINNWVNSLLFSNNDIEKRLNNCLVNLKIKGASKGLATLLLYLSNSKIYNIWVNKTEEGLLVLNRLSGLSGNKWGNNYKVFNNSTINFRDSHNFIPQEIDWILTFIAGFVESSENYFLIDEESLSPSVALSVDDEDDLDDVVGEPMELEVMRWTPTNEMGVVALFIEFRKELGFPIIEIIRTKFPDSVVFENSSEGYIRKYIEFEFRSSGYKSHLKSKRKCHYVICWEHDWKDCPIPVIELKNEIPKILKNIRANNSLQPTAKGGG